MENQIIKSKEEFKKCTSKSKPLNKVSNNREIAKEKISEEHQCIKKIDLKDFCFFKYPYTSHLDKNLWVVQDNLSKKMALFHSSYKKITEFKYDFIEKGDKLPANCYLIGINYKNKGTFIGVLNENGNEIIPPIYDNIICFNENLASVSKNNKYGYIDIKNNIIIPFIYDKADNFSNGFAKVVLNNKNLKINKNGNIISQ